MERVGEGLGTVSEGLGKKKEGLGKHCRRVRKDSEGSVSGKEEFGKG